jgi:hypothetical protein
VKAYFDLSTLGPWNRKAHQKAWEQMLGRASSSDSTLSVATDRAAADVIIHTGSPGYFDSTLSSMLSSITQSDVERIVWDWGDAPLGRYSGFYCSLNSVLFDSRRHRTMSYPIAFNELVEEFPQEDVKYDFSFVGGITSGVRTRIFRTLADEGKLNSLLQVQPATWNTILDSSDTKIKRDYVESLRRSRFVLCPRGAGLGSVRLFETMKAGRVPVIIADGFVPPSGVNWKSCSIFVHEAEVARIPQIIASRAHEWPEMARRSRQIWEENFADAAVLAYLGTQLAEILRTKPTVDLSLQVAYSSRVVRILLEHKLRPVAGRIRRLASSSTSPV